MITIPQLKRQYSAQNLTDVKRLTNHELARESNYEDKEILL